MSKSTLSKTVQTQIAKEGAIAGTVAAVRATLQQILQDTRFRRIEATYGPNPKPKPGKEPGTKYAVTAAGGTDSKGIQTAEQVATRLVDNDLINIHCVDSGRRGTRSLKVPLICSVQVYTGRKVPNPKKPGLFVAERKTVPVVCLKVN
jgi:hypothetical protein